VVVDHPLTAAFDFASPGGVAPVTVQFSDRSLGGATSWSWDFGDGTTSGTRNPSHTFEEGGTFTVRLAVTAPDQADETSLPVEIGEPPPVADFAASAVAGSVPLRVQFTDLSRGNITAWQWDFGDGKGSFERNPFHAYRVAGTYTVRFRVWSAGGVDGEIRRGLIRVTNPLQRILRLGGGGGSRPASGPVPRAPDLELSDE
jgi:PKD repeat protein